VFDPKVPPWAEAHGGSIHIFQTLASRKDAKIQRRLGRNVAEGEQEKESNTPEQLCEWMDNCAAQRPNVRVRRVHALAIIAHQNWVSGGGRSLPQTGRVFQHQRISFWPDCKTLRGGPEYAYNLKSLKEVNPLKGRKQSQSKKSDNRQKRDSNRSREDRRESKTDREGRQ
jgi:hypothetical protein